MDKTLIWFVHNKVTSIMKFCFTISLCLIVLSACNTGSGKKDTKEGAAIPKEDTSYISISRAKYKDQLYGFWLG
ncbi:MAG: hypothetical protein JSV59_13050, partial [Flavobacteriaceae bacterium]